MCTKQSTCSYQLKKLSRLQHDGWNMYTYSAPIRCHRFSREEILHTWKNWIMWRVIRMILWRDLQNSGYWLIVAINQEPYHVCYLISEVQKRLVCSGNLRPHNKFGRIYTIQHITSTVARQPPTPLSYCLTDQEPLDLSPLSMPAYIFRQLCNWTRISYPRDFKSLFLLA